ncbi:TolC family protein [Pseudoflavitalea sp. X16]|uniref:TolC family protein n=1 Tax=Paraflavitalea devenefica TaxID=2716334 RepID=UPI001420D2EB|nr:TolC family protein [Paraflavitalea devenefica]NII26096.1 TolC family protein [Paraflavitalea devenefica]
MAPPGIRTGILMACLFLSGPLQSQKIFTSVDSLLAYAASTSISVQSGYIRLDQAKKARLAAILSIPDVTGNASFSYTKNTQLPVNLFPAEVFGGQPGTFKEVQSGIPYVTNANENVDIKLFSLKGWVNLKLYKLNMESSISENKVTLKELLENVAAAYYNIVSLQEQLTSTIENVTTASSLLAITQNKYKAGLVKQQDVNDANINYITTKENKTQLEYLIKQQYIALKILCDIPAAEAITIVNRSPLTAFNANPSVAANTIALTNSLFKEKIALSTWKQQKYSLYPTLSFFQSYTTQQNNTRSKLFDNSVKWIPSSYIGLRLSIQIPSSTTITQVSKAKYDYLLAQKDTEQQKIKSDLTLQQLRTDYDKAFSQAASNQEIFLLSKENYEKYLNLYKEGLADLEQTLDRFNTMVSSHYNLVSSQVTVLAAQTKIDINNRLQ